jgi:hypothetical protein
MTNAIVRRTNTTHMAPIGSGKLVCKNGNEFSYTEIPTAEEIAADMAATESVGVWAKWRWHYCYQMGFDLHGEEMSQYLSHRYEPSYGANIIWVGNSVPQANRVFDHTLSFSHYQAVAPISDKDIQYEVLLMAEENQWSVAETKLVVQQMREDAGESITFLVPKPLVRHEDGVLLAVQFLKGQTKFKQSDVIDVLERLLES